MKYWSRLPWEIVQSLLLEVCKGRLVGYFREVIEAYPVPVWGGTRLCLKGPSRYIFMILWLIIPFHTIKHGLKFSVVVNVFLVFQGKWVWQGSNRSCHNILVLRFFRTSSVLLSCFCDKLDSVQGEQNLFSLHMLRYSLYSCVIVQLVESKKLKTFFSQERSIINNVILSNLPQFTLFLESYLEIVFAWE